MMRVVEEQQIMSAAGRGGARCARPADAIPFVDQHERGAVQRFVEVERIRIDRVPRSTPDTPGGTPRSRQDRLRQQVRTLQASIGCRPDLVAARQSSVADTAQKCALP